MLYCVVYVISLVRRMKWVQVELTEVRGRGRSDAIDFNEPDEGIVYVCLCER